MELLHIPHKENQKNSADILITTDDKIDLSKLASSLGKHKSINYKDLGYQQFKNALLDMQDKALIKLQRKKDSNAWDVVRLV